MTNIDCSEWEEWQKEYRHGAFFVFPPDGIFEKINSLRELYDPKSQSVCGAHISLTVPLSRELLERDYDEIQNTLSEVDRFEVQFGPTYNYPGIPGVVLRVEPSSLFKNLVIRLEEASVFQNAISRKHPFSPHMTIAEFVTMDRTKEILDELKGQDLSGTFECSQVFYAAPDCDFVFRRGPSFSLKR